MMKISHLVDDAIRLRFVPIAFKDLAKKWLYSLTVGSITLWNDFIKAFLKKLYPIHKTVLIRKDIMQLKYEPSEPFWKYFKRFRDLLIQCPHHGIEK